LAHRFYSLPNHMRAVSFTIASTAKLVRAQCHPCFSDKYER